MPLSQKQMEYLALAWQCFESEPKIDYKKFKEVAGLASAHSARELMRVTKKKLKEEYGALSGGIQAGNSGNSTPKKVGGAASANGTPTPTPKKRGGGGRPRKTPVKEMANETAEDASGDESPSKIAKTNGKSPVKAEPVEQEQEQDEEAGWFQ